MDTTVLSTIMIAVGMLMFLFPFFVYVTLGPLLNASENDPRMLGTLLVGGAILFYGISVGVFTLVQRYNCGSVQSMKRITDNAGTSTLIYSVLMVLATFIPWLRSVVTNILPPEVGANISQSLGYGYYSFWGSLFGIAVGGSLSGICN